VCLSVFYVSCRRRQERLRSPAFELARYCGRILPLEPRPARSPALMKPSPGESAITCRHGDRIQTRCVDQLARSTGRRVHGTETNLCGGLSEAPSFELRRARGSAEVLPPRLSSPFKVVDALHGARIRGGGELSRVGGSCRRLLNAPTKPSVPGQD
jgi:hypothetical protein